MHIDLTWLSYLTFVVVAYYAILFLHPLYSRHRPRGDSEPLMVLVIPAHNEEAVIAPTLDSLTGLDYSRRLILVMNDGSHDRTSEIARGYADRGVLVVDRGADVAGQGKGAVLNHAFRLIRGMVEADDPALLGHTEDDIVIAILDADGQLEPDALSKVAPYFAEPHVGGVQIGVRIANARANAVARMQDLEFVGFSAFVQQARDAFGSVGLGGNGQFTRLSALTSLNRDPWTHCLTEDLELSLSLVEQGWRVRFCSTTYVAQQGLTQLRPLLRQRTRWIQGHYQCWRHLPALWSSRKLPLHTKIDLSIYLVMVTFVMVVFIGVMVSIAALAGVVTVENNSLGWIDNWHLHNALLLTLSCGPLTAFIVTYQRRAWHPLRFWELPAFAMFFSMYAYLFVVSQIWAWGRMVMRRGAWAKTPRLQAEHAVATAAEHAGVSR